MSTRHSQHLPARSSFVSPRLFVRSAQLATLRFALERARGGMSGTVLVTGDARVGKSRLIATVRAGGPRSLRSADLHGDACVRETRH
jgi:hypothetical protein